MRYLVFSLAIATLGTASPAAAAKATVSRTESSVTAVSSPQKSEWPQVDADALLKRLSASLQKANAVASLKLYAGGETIENALPNGAREQRRTRFAIVRFWPSTKLPTLLLQLDEATIECDNASPECVPSTTMKASGPLVAYDRMLQPTDVLADLRASQSLSLSLSRPSAASVWTFTTTLNISGDKFEGGLRRFFSTFAPRSQAPSQRDALRLIGSLLSDMHEEVNQ